MVYGLVFCKRTGCFNPRFEWRAGRYHQNPKILLFDGCNSFVECSPGKTVDTDEFLFNNLRLNRLYYIMIESSVGGEGSFRLCVDLLNSVKIPESDCSSGVVLCDKSPFVVSSLTGAGNNANEIEANNCIERSFNLRGINGHATSPEP